MLSDKRKRYDVDLRRKAMEIRGTGRGYKATAVLLGIPPDTVRQWFRTAEAVGIEEFLSQKKKYTSYPYETKVAAASAVVDDGRGKPEVLAVFGIASEASLDRWCKAYRESGATGLMPKPKGRPRGARTKPKGTSRERELEVRVRKLEAENAYLKKLSALGAEESLRTGRRPRR